MIYTHLGRIEGNDARSDNYSRLVELRQSKLYWITKNGEKFRKDTGRAPGKWPMFRLNLETIKKRTGV